MASFVSATLVGTVASTSFSIAHTASAGDVEVFICVAERGTTGTSPSALSYGGVNVLTSGVAVTALATTPSGQRCHRWYHLPRALHPGAGSRTVACTWAGVDNIAVAVIEVSATGTVTIPSNNQAASGTVAITAGSGDLTIGCAQGNSATPAFSPSSGQTEYLESVWFASSGHVVGVQTGTQTAASWTGAGSICASAFVVHEESSSSSYGVSTETDSAVALVGSARASYGVTTETDSAVALVGSDRSAYGIATETNAAVALSATNQAAFGVATETDAAVALAGFESVAYGVAAETDEAIALESAAIVPGISLETDTAIALVGSDHAAYGIATETGAAVALVGSSLAVYGVATETDTALALVGSLAAFYGVALETDQAIALAMVTVHASAPPARTIRDGFEGRTYGDADPARAIMDERAAVIFD